MSPRPSSWRISFIHQLAWHKAPGIDGLSINYYKMFKGALAGPLLKLFEHCLTTGMLPSTTRTSVISLLHKKNERNLIKNYRPISLTNTDYKILSKHHNSG